MKMILSISWRNIWRNKSRSAVILVALVLGVCSGIFAVAFMLGMAEQRINNVIQTELSHIQVHNKKYLETEDMQDVMHGTNKMVGQIMEIPNVSGVSQRLIVNAMARSAETATGIVVNGIDPEAEKQVSNIFEKLIHGTYFDGVKRNPILIGEKLAEKLNIKLRSKVILTFQEKDGTLTGAAFRVVGTFKTVSTPFDGSNVFVRRTDLENLTGFTHDEAHEIAVLISGNEFTETVLKDIKSRIADQEILPWAELMPELGYLNESMFMYMFIYMIVILMALGFGIVNTMLMAILERVKELGMLMAVGMNKIRVFFMIMTETVLLSLTGGAGGVFLGVLFVTYFNKYGLDLGTWQQGAEAYGYESIVYFTIDPGSVIIIAVLIVITGIIASIYPAYKALKLNPAEAIRIDM